MTIRKRRSIIEIQIQLLDECMKNKRTQSWLLRKLNLTTATIKDSIMYLVKKGLLLKINNPKTQNNEYAITKKGVEALNLYFKLMKDYLL